MSTNFEWGPLIDVGIEILRAGRNGAPHVLYELYIEGQLTSGDVRAHVGPAWSACERPDTCLPREAWRELFDIADFTVDGQLAPRPESAIVLYRGSLADSRTNWSWTGDANVARAYASGKYSRPRDGQVWTAVVAPWRLFVYDNGRREDEYVIDTAGLEINPLDRMP